MTVQTTWRPGFPEGRNANGGWFRSGDGGYMVDGYVYINDRKPCPTWCEPERGARFQREMSLRAGR